MGIRSFRSLFALFKRAKRANPSLRSLQKEQCEESLSLLVSGSICSLFRTQERFTLCERAIARRAIHIALYKKGEKSKKSERAFCSFFWSKNVLFARKTKEQILNPGLGKIGHHNPFYGRKHTSLVLYNYINTSICSLFLVSENNFNFNR